MGPMDQILGVHRPPPGALPVSVRTDRPDRLSRYHVGARVDAGTLLLPEACNLDQAVDLVVDIDPGEAYAAQAVQRCRRCYPR